MFRKTVLCLAVSTAARSGMGASAAHAAGKGPCLVAPERKAAINARIAATHANIVALAAAKAQAVGHPKVAARLDVRLAKANVNLVAEQQHLATIVGESRE